MCSTFFLDDGRRSAFRRLQISSLVSLALLACSFDEVSLGEGETAGAPAQGACALGASGVVEGDVLVESQAALDALAGCSEVTGSLDIIARRDFELAPLASLRVVRGVLSIAGATPSDTLDDLTGLEGLERSGELYLRQLDVASLAPLTHLAAVRPDPLANPAPENNLIGRASVYISDCPHLVDLRGLENLAVWDEMVLIRATALESLRGLVAIRENQSLEIHGAPILRDLDNLGGSSRMARVVLEGSGLQRFELEQPLYLDHLEFRSNPELVSLDGLQALQSLEELVIQDDDRLERLPQLPYLRNLRSLSIQDNDSLHTLPEWIVADDGDFLPPEGFEEPTEFSPPDFAVAEILGNPQLVELALPTTFRYGGRITIYDNASLTTITLPYLDSADHLTIADNASLTQVDIPALERVDDLHVLNNPSLAPTAFENVESYAREIQGNLDTTAP